MLKTAREPDLRAKQQGFVFQVQAVAAIKDLQFAAVFHEQGLGKTKIGVDLALYWLTHDIVDSVLVITKKSLIQNWHDELEYTRTCSPGFSLKTEERTFTLSTALLGFI